MTTTDELREAVARAIRQPATREEGDRRLPNEIKADRIIRMVVERCAREARETRTFDWKGGEEWAAGYVDGKNAAADRILALAPKEPAP